MRRFGLLFSTMVVAVLGMADGVRAGKCLDDCGGRCARRVRCVERVCCCCEVTCDVCVPAVCECAAPAAVKVKPQAKPAPAHARPLPPVTSEKPAARKPTEPAPAKPAEEPKAPAPVPPPAEKPAETSPKAPAAAAPKPVAPPATPPKPAAAAPAPAKPAEPKKEEKKADAPAKKTAAAGRGYRTWSDVTGAYHVEARLVATLDQGTVVRLLRADGRYVRVAFQRLSQEDQSYVLGQAVALALNQGAGLRYPGGHGRKP